MSQNPFRLQYGPDAPGDRFARLEGLKSAMADAIVNDPEAVIDASRVTHVDTPLLQMISAVAFAGRAVSVPLHVLDPPIDLVLGFDKLGIDWRGLGITFRDS